MWRRHGVNYDLIRCRWRQRGWRWSCLSGVPALVYGEPFLTGIWWEVPLLFGAVFDLGTPLIFDVGVYLVVWGILLTLVFALGEEA